MSYQFPSVAEALEAVHSSVVSNLRLTFDIGTRDLPSGDPVHWLVESLKHGYVEGRLSTDRFEEQIDAVLRYGDKIEWRPYVGTALRIPDDDLWRYPALVEWAS
jgi:hypothetical protein